MANKIRVLFLAANPIDSGYQLRLGEEAREIGKRIRVGDHRDSFDLNPEFAVRASDLQEAMLRRRPHIVHFSGHGSKTEGIVLEDNLGKSKLLNKSALAGLFRILKDDIKVVVLNACYAKDQALGLIETIDYTIGMNDTIGDRAAIVFASFFYQSLAFGRTVTESFELALNQLDLEGIPGSNVPELLVRRDVDTSIPLVERKAKTHRDRAGFDPSFKGARIGQANVIKGDKNLIVGKVVSKKQK